MSALDAVPALAERVRGGRREEPFRGGTDLPNFLRKPYGSGWALVGDAGCHKEPFLALGVCDAFRDAELLADSLDEGLSGRRPLAEALEQFERQRNEATLPDYQQNVQLSAPATTTRRDGGASRSPAWQPGGDEQVLPGHGGNDPAGDVLQSRDHAASSGWDIVASNRRRQAVIEKAITVTRQKVPCITHPQEAGD